MTHRIEILVELEIDTNGPSEAEAIRIARHKLARVAEVGHCTFRVVGTALLTREQSKALRLATAAAKNGGKCELCGHSLEDNQHGFDQNDFDIDENENLVYCGHCTYCNECMAELANTEVGA